MVVPALQLASKIPDVSVQLWSSALLKGRIVEVELKTTPGPFLGGKECKLSLGAKVT